MLRKALASILAVVVAGSAAAAFAQSCTSSITLTPITQFDCDSVRVRVSAGGNTSACCPPPVNLCSAAFSVLYTITPCPPPQPCIGGMFTATLPAGQDLVVTLDAHTLYTISATNSVDYIFFHCGFFGCPCDGSFRCNAPEATLTYRNCQPVDVEETTWSRVKSLVR